MDANFAHAIVICTRNRPDDVVRVLRSIAQQEEAPAHLVLLVDASDAEAATRNAEAVRATEDTTTGLGVRHHLFAGTPSLARQRNAGLDLLPPSVRIVHFLDDDVTLQPGYLRHLSAVFDEGPEVVGAGGRLVEPHRAGTTRRRTHRLTRLFLLDGATPGRVLPSGSTTAGQLADRDAPFLTQWLGGCCAYRRSIFAHVRFDPALDGYSLDEDLDFSYRAGQHGVLYVEPRAVLVHHASPVNRAAAGAMMRDALIHRYWFVRKNLGTPLHEAAFWWAVVGRLLALLTTSHPDRRQLVHGLLAGARSVLTRAHPLLQALPPR